MRQETINIYQYDELSNPAKEKAREWVKSFEYFGVDDGVQSVEAFCRHYGVMLTDYSLSPYSYSDINTNAEAKHFRGVTLKQVEKVKDLMPTGYCIDCDLFITMYESMRDNGGNALQAFNSAIEAGKRAIISDMEYQDSDEYAEEMIQANEYEFLENGATA